MKETSQLRALKRDHPNIPITSLERLERNDREDQYGNAPLQQRGDVTVSGAFNDVSRIITSNNG